MTGPLQQQPDVLTVYEAGAYGVDGGAVPGTALFAEQQDAQAHADLMNGVTAPALRPTAEDARLDLHGRVFTVRPVPIQTGPTGDRVFWSQRVCPAGTRKYPLRRHVVAPGQDWPVYPESLRTVEGIGTLVEGPDRAEVEAEAERLSAAL